MKKLAFVLPAVAVVAVVAFSGSFAGQATAVAAPAAEVATVKSQASESQIVTDENMEMTRRNASRTSRFIP